MLTLLIRFGCAAGAGILFGLAAEDWQVGVAFSLAIMALLPDGRL